MSPPDKQFFFVIEFSLTKVHLTRMLCIFQAPICPSFVFLQVQWLTYIRYSINICGINKFKNSLHFHFLLSAESPKQISWIMDWGYTIYLATDDKCHIIKLLVQQWHSLDKTILFVSSHHLLNNWCECCLFKNNNGVSIFFKYVFAEQKKKISKPKSD